MGAATSSTANTLALAKDRFRARLGAALACLLALSGMSARAQAPAPLAAPNLAVFAAGEVNAVARLPDGGVIVGGLFSSVYDPVSQLNLGRNNLAKFSASGALDLLWNPSPNFRVSALAVDASGAVYAGGLFDSIGGQARSKIAKLSGTGSGAADPTWNPSAAGVSPSVYALATDPSGAVYAGGFFTSIGGQVRNSIAKLSGTSGAADPNWNSSADSAVYTLAVDASGAVYAGGYFSSIGGQARNRIAKLSGTGSGAADPSWNPSASGGLSTIVYALAWDPNGAVYVGGSFTAIGGQARNFIAKLSGTGSGGADSNWNPSANGGVDALAVDSVGSVYAGGGFTVIGGQARNRIAKLEGAGTGAADTSWSPSANGPLRALAIDINGAVFAGGAFSALDGQVGLGFAHLSGSGTLLTSPYVQARGSVDAIALAPDGSSYVGGNFARVDATVRRNAFKLTANRTLDAIWNPAPDGLVRALATDANGAVYVGGSFTFVGGQPRNGLAKLSDTGSGSADANWNPSPASAGASLISTLAIDPGGAVYAAGLFSSIGGQLRNNVAKLSGTGLGAADPNWNPSADNIVWDLNIDASGAVYVGGDFTSIGGQARTNLAKLSGTGSGGVDPDWNPSPNNTVYALALDPGGTVYTAGSFTSIGGQTRKYVAKLAGTGSGAADPIWDPSSNNTVVELMIDPVGAVYAGGFFLAIGGQARTRIAKLSGTGTGAADPTWNPFATGPVRVLATVPGGVVLVGGEFGAIGGSPRELIAALPLVVDVMFQDGFENP